MRLLPLSFDPFATDAYGSCHSALLLRLDARQQRGAGCRVLDQAKLILQLTESRQIFLGLRLRSEAFEELSRVSQLFDLDAQLMEFTSM